MMRRWRILRPSLLHNRAKYPNLRFLLLVLGWYSCPYVVHLTPPICMSLPGRMPASSPVTDAEKPAISLPSIRCDQGFVAADEPPSQRLDPVK